jgi:inorganic pyrophosphatase
MRKLVGKIRDKDVFTGSASTIHIVGEEECLIQLLEYLGAKHYRHNGKARRLIKKRGPNPVEATMIQKRRSIGKPTIPSSIDVIIETPKGSRNKFKYDPTTRMFKLSKVLPQGRMFPYDFGFVPSTIGGDGDPIDVLVPMDEPTFPGCLLECRLIGVMEAEQEEKQQNKKRNDRLLAVAVQSFLYSEITHIRELNPTLLKQIEAFLSITRRLEEYVSLSWLARDPPQLCRPWKPELPKKRKALVSLI